MKAEIIRLLKECDGYLSGQQICDRFQVSRTAVWKVIEQLKKEGYQIEAVRNKGYHLEDSPDVISRAEIESLTRGGWAGACAVYMMRRIRRITVPRMPEREARHMAHCM